MRLIIYSSLEMAEQQSQQKQWDHGQTHIFDRSISARTLRKIHAISFIALTNGFAVGISHASGPRFRTGEIGSNFTTSSEELESKPSVLVNILGRAFTGFA